MPNEQTDAQKMEQIVDMIMARKLPQARQVADTIADVDYREWMLNDTVKSMLNAGAVDPAISTARFMTISYYKADALRAIARHVASMGDAATAMSIVEETNRIPIDVVLPTALDSDIAPDKAQGLYDIANLLSKGSNTTQAQALKAEAIKVAQAGEKSANRQHSLDSSKLLRNFARDLAVAGDMNAARAVAQSIANPFIQGETLDMLEEMSGGAQA